MAELERQQLIEQEEIKQYEKSKIGVEEDSYNFFFMRLVQWWDGTTSVNFWLRHGEYRGRFRSVPLVSLIHGCALYFIGAGIQVWVTLLLYYNSLDMTHKWRHFRAQSGESTLTLHETAKLVRDEVMTGALPNSLLCECAGTRNVKQNSCYVFVMALWVARMIPEFRMAYSMWRNIRLLEIRKDRSMPLFDTDGSTILRLDLPLKILLMIFIPVLRLFVAFLVTYAGFEFLVAQEQTGDIVVKALCMQFVTDIDNLMLKAFASEAGRRQLSQTKLYVFEDPKPFRRWGPDVWDEGVGGLCYLAIGIFVILAFTGGNGELPGFFDGGLVSWNLMYFRMQCQTYCEAWAELCEPEDMTSLRTYC